MDKTVALTIVVNGQRTHLQGDLDDELEAIIPLALAQTGNAGQPPDNWELRTNEGQILDLERKIGSFRFHPGTTLFLNLKAGVGGSCGRAAVR